LLAQIVVPVREPSRTASIRQSKVLILGFVVATIARDHCSMRSSRPDQSGAIGGGKWLNTHCDAIGRVAPEAPLRIADRRPPLPRRLFDCVLRHRREVAVS